MKADESKAGAVATCPGCGVKFRIPRAKADPASSSSITAQKDSMRSSAITQKPPLDPRVRLAARRSEQPKPPGADAGGPAHSGSPTAEEAEELEYSLDDVHDRQSPPLPKKLRPIEPDDEEEPVAVEEEPEDDEAIDEEEEGEAARRRKKKKKKTDPSKAVVPLLVGGSALFVVLLCSGGIYYLANRKKPPPDPEKALEMVKKRGGSIERDLQDPEQPVIGVSLIATDAPKERGDMELLLAFPKLRKLNLSHSKVENWDLECLKELHDLRVLNVSFSHITDGGMRYIGKIKSLEEVYLDQTLVTDNGLEDLRGLTNLKKLGVSGSLASGLGLQAAIPNLQVNR
jgi:Leucine-rich repeat (LRR) protein